MKNSRWLSLIVLCTGFLLIVVDMTIVNVALPSIQKDLGFSQSGLAWIVNAYLIAFGGLLLLAGRVGDLLGRKRVYLVGLAIFTGASVLCGLSFAQPMLIGARFVQGIGGAISSAVILAMIVTMFPEPNERAKAFGVFTFVASAGAVVGLLAGGLITQAISWHWIFFVNLPIGIATAVAAARTLDDDRGIGLGRGADVLGAGLVTSALMLGVYTIVQTSEYGLGSARTIVLGGVALALLAGFVVRQALGRNPPAPRLPLAEGGGRQRHPGAHLDLVLGVLLPRLARPPARPRLRSDGDRAGVPPGGHRDGPLLDPVLGPAHRSLRRGPDAGRGPGPGGDRPGHCRARPDERQLPCSPARADGPARARRRSRVPVADDARDGRRPPGRSGPGVRPAEHDRSGGRRARPRRDGHAGGVAHRGPDWRRRRRGLRAGRRVPLRLARRSRHRGGHAGNVGLAASLELRPAGRACARRMRRVRGGGLNAS